MIYICNAFSLQMGTPPFTLKVERSDLQEVVKIFVHYWASQKITPAIGHPDTARIAAKMINGLTAKLYPWWEPLADQALFQRCNIDLKLGDILYVIQVMGGRLPEGATMLPEGVSLRWLKAELSEWIAPDFLKN